MRHIRDVNPQPPLFRRHAFQANGVVKIFRVVGINRDDIVRPTIHPAEEIVQVNRRTDGVRFMQHGLGKVERQVILAQHGKHVHAFLVRRAKNFHDFALGTRVARFPFAQFDHDLVADPPGPAHITRRRHINIVRHARVVGDDVKRVAALRQCADDLGALAFEDADDRAGFLVAVAKTFPVHIAPHQHAIFMQRRAGGAFGDGDFFEA